MRHLLQPPPVFMLIYQAAIVVIVSVVALLAVSDVPPLVRLPLIALNVVILLRVAGLLWAMLRNRGAGGY